MSTNDSMRVEYCTPSAELQNWMARFKLTGELMDTLLRDLPPCVSRETLRQLDAARTHLEAAVMFGVKAATAPDVRDRVGK